MGNSASQSFYKTSTWTAPAGVTQVTVTAQKTLQAAGGLGGTSQTTWFLDSLGNIFMCGQGAGGQLGDGTNGTSKSSPVLVIGGLNFSNGMYLSNHISAGATAIALNPQGKAFSWGANNSHGQLGDNTIADKSSPVQVVGNLTFSALQQGGQQTIVGLSPNGTMYAWGANNSGDIGNGVDPSVVTNYSSPVAVVGGLRFGTFTIAGSGQQVFSLTPAGSLFSWGRNTNGILGVNSNPATVIALSSPVAVVGGLTFALLASTHNGPNAMAMGAITNNDQAYMWGVNTQGNLGDGTTTDRSSPVAVVGGLLFKQLVMSSTSAFGLTTTGIAYSWGNNSQGQLGDGTTTNRSSPVQVVGGLTFAKIIAANPNTLVTSGFGLTADGVLYGWGQNANGELGIGDTNNRSSPVQVLGGLIFRDVYTAINQNNGLSMFGITQNNQIYAWGYNGTGQLGVGDINPRSSPVAVLGGFTAMPPQITQTIIPVVPGTTYSIKMNQYFASFGNTVIGKNNPELVTVSFAE